MYILTPSTLFTRKDVRYVVFPWVIESPAVEWQKKKIHRSQHGHTDRQKTTGAKKILTKEKLKLNGQPTSYIQELQGSSLTLFPV